VQVEVGVPNGVVVGIDAVGAGFGQEGLEGLWHLRRKRGVAAAHLGDQQSRFGVLCCPRPIGKDAALQHAVVIGTHRDVHRGRKFNALLKVVQIGIDEQAVNVAPLKILRGDQGSLVACAAGVVKHAGCAVDPTGGVDALNAVEHVRHGHHGARPNGHGVFKRDQLTPRLHGREMGRGVMG